MSVQHQEFRGRVARLQSKHAGFSQGATARVKSDGLIVIEPRKIRSNTSGKVLILIVAAFLLFKAFLMAALGFDTYDERVAKLTEGSAIEQLGAVIMQSDPVSVWAAQQAGPILR
ncbi:hypothetical protein [Pseudophaeobacter sp.]|jgi:hypothetical protein|uniref:Uncharacterized protein n=1 Tax=Pseudophaeobacter arcticus TaxID=385492 RepID=A0ABQ0AJP0_9RHOB